MKKRTLMMKKALQEKEDKKVEMGNNTEINIEHETTNSRDGTKDFDVLKAQRQIELEQEKDELEEWESQKKDDMLQK